MLILLPLLGVLFNGLTTAHVEANLSLEFKATKLLRQHNPANCTVGNTTYAHGQTFKLDCKTQCVCENGRHACSSLCPKEQLPAPEDTMSCRSPRLVEVPGHCCKMWLCENPTADVYATCHNASTSPWTPCSRPCGLGISTRFTSTNTGCRQLSSIRLCENRKCDEDNNNKNYSTSQQSQLAQKVIAVPQKYAHEQRQQQLISHNVASNLVVSEPGDTKDLKNYRALFEHKEHRIRKGHECRSLQRLGPARIRLGACISRKLYRPKLCGRCHQHSGKCCTPSVSTTIQVELLCPLKADDPVNFAEQQQLEGQAPLQLWDTVSLEPIDQEFLQSHQIQIENKFIAVEWILKCECGKYENCNNLQKYTATMHSSSGNKSNNSYNNQKQSKNDSNSKSNNNSSWHTSGAVGDHNNNKNAATDIISDTTYNYNENAYNNNKNDVNMSSSGNNKGNKGSMANNHYNEQSIEVDNDSDNRYVQQQEQQADTAQQEQQQRLVSSGELQPDIIPYPAMLPPHRNTQQQNQTQMGQSNGDKRNSNNNKNKGSKYDNRSGIKGGIVDGTVSDDSMRVNAEHDNNNNNIKAIKNVAVPNKNENKIFASFAFYHHDGNDVDDKRDAGHSTSDDSSKQYVSDGQHQNALNEDGEQQQQLQLHKLQRLQDWEMDQNLHYQKQQSPTSESSLAASHQYYPQHQQKHHQHHQHHHHHHQQHHQHHLHHHQLYPHTHPHSHTPQYTPQSQQHFLEQLRQQQEQPIEQQTFHQRRS